MKPCCSTGDLFGVIAVPETATAIVPRLVARPLGPTDLKIVAGYGDEPRLHDLRLAEVLDFERPRNIRLLIKRLHKQLERHGVICFTVQQITGPGRPAEEYWLTLGQALFVCTHSETPNADEVRHALIDVFKAFKCGDLVPRNAETSANTTAAAAPIEEMMSRAMAPVHALVLQVDGKVDGLEQLVLQLYKRVDDDAPRNDFPVFVQGYWIAVIRKKYGGRCPCCQERLILDDQGKPMAGVAQCEHRGRRDKVDPEDGWLTCKKCNDDLYQKRTYANETRLQFNLFQHWLALEMAIQKTFNFPAIGRHA